MIYIYPRTKSIPRNACERPAMVGAPGSKEVRAVDIYNFCHLKWRGQVVRSSRSTSTMCTVGSAINTIYKVSACWDLDIDMERMGHRSIAVQFISGLHMASDY
jgi:hypothetical protein